MCDITLLVMAAGMGSRYGGLKQLDPVGPNNETIIDYSVFDAIRTGFNKVVFIIREEFRADFESQITNKYTDIIEVDFAIQDINNVASNSSIRYFTIYRETTFKIFFIYGCFLNKLHSFFGSPDIVRTWGTRNNHHICCHDARAC